MCPNHTQTHTVLFPPLSFNISCKKSKSSKSSSFHSHSNSLLSLFRHPHKCLRNGGPCRPVLLDASRWPPFPRAFVCCLFAVADCLFAPAIGRLVGQSMGQGRECPFRLPPPHRCNKRAPIPIHPADRRLCSAPASRPAVGWLIIYAAEHSASWARFTPHIMGGNKGRSRGILVKAKNWAMGKEGGTFT